MADDFVKVEHGFLFLTFGLFAYLPTLPDPYAADLGFLKFQFRGDRDNLAGTTSSAGSPSGCGWCARCSGSRALEEEDKVKVSFFFAPLQNQFQVLHGGRGQRSPVCRSRAALPVRCHLLNPDLPDL